MRPHSESGSPPAADTDVGRPSSAPAPSDRIREWIDWFGVTRLVTSALAVVVVCVGAWWLVRTPLPPPESMLPTATSGSTPPVVTLPPPTAAEVVEEVGIDEPSSEQAGPESVVVHVAGAVVVPGVYRLDPDDRVADAVDLAGGSTDAADPSAVNLAALLVDGSRIYVPEVGEDVPPSLASSTVAPTESSGSAQVTGPVDVNSADERALQELPGVGPATAAAIVTERDRNGPFASFGDLERVPGIGPAKLAALEGLVVT